jgi:phosphoserine phosphatase
MCSAGSPGLSTLKTDAILIFDLDGTLLSVNSFPYWARYMLTGHFEGLSLMERLGLSLRSSQILLERKLLRRNHYRAKRQLQTLWGRALEKDSKQAALRNLCAFLQNHIRPNMQSLMTAIAARQVDALLATSAAGEYAQELGKALGFTHILATPLCSESDDLENRGERKRDRVLSLLAAQGWDHRPRIFFTDHAEDVPLIRECQRTLWFGSDENATSLQASLPQIKIIACRNTLDKEILRLAGGG